MPPKKRAPSRQDVEEEDDEDEEESYLSESSSSTSDPDVDSEESDNNLGAVVASKTANRERTVKQRLIAQILARWWYALPEWPPPDFDYEAELKKRRLRKVGFEQWETEDDVDGEGMTKVYEISHYPGVYRDPWGNAIDLRPIEGRPCYSNLYRKTETDLRSLLKIAVENQLREIDESPYIQTDFDAIQKLKNDLKGLLS